MVHRIYVFIVCAMLVGCVVVASVFATTRTVSLSGTGVASGGSTPVPPTLTSAFVVQPGAVYSGTGCTINGNGSTDDSTCLLAALNGGHDLDMKAGNYLWTRTSWSSIPNGRNIYCENTPPATQTTPTWSSNPSGVVVSGTWSNGAAVAFSAPSSNAGQSTPAYQMIQLGTNNKVYGCQFRGPHYPNVTWLTDYFVFEGALNMTVNSGNDTIAENDFQGWGGTVGAINVYPSGQAGRGYLPTNILITYNSVRNSGVRGIEIDGGMGQITNNYFLDSPVEQEANNDSGVQWMGEILFDSNWFHWVNGGDGGNLGTTGSTWCFANWGGNRESAGQVTHSPGTPDYSQNTFSNNYVDGSFTNCIAEGNGGDGAILGVYRNNSCNGGCSLYQPPGNPNANHWGAGSNQ